MILNINNYKDVSPKDVARFEEIAYLVRHLYTAYEQLSEEDIGKLPAKKAVDALFTTFILDHLPSMVDRLENHKLKADIIESIERSRL